MEYFCPDGVIGSRVRLKIESRKGWRFNSSSGHIMILYHLIIILLLIAIVIQFTCIVLVYLGKKKTKVPYLPVHNELLPMIYEELHLESDSVLYDFGCGDGKVLRYCLQQKPTISTTGIEWALLPFIIAKVWNMFFPLKNLLLLRKDFFTIKIDNATHVFVYLLPPVLDKLLPKLQSECKPGTIIVSPNYQFSNIKPVKIREITELNLVKKYTLYTYVL